MVRRTIEKHKDFWQQRAHIISVSVGLLMFIVSLVANHYANFYASIYVSNSVTDLLIDNVPVVNVQVLYANGPILFSLVVFVILLFEPRYISFVLKSLSLFVVIRSFFMMLTHLAPPPTEIYLDPSDFIQRLSWGNDLFFSGHVGVPFLLGVMFWKKILLRYFFLFCTVAGGVIVILGHLHYSIDVFSALFISFGIYHISRFLFRKDFRVFSSAYFNVKAD